jgi:hypothetical protein
MSPVSEPHRLTCLTVLVWMWQLGLVIRSIVTSHVPAQAFILVSLGSLLVLMVGWRVAFVYVFASGGNTVEKSPGNRSGGVFEFLEVWFSFLVSDLDSICDKSVLLSKHLQTLPGS